MSETEKPYWNVTFSINGESVLSIEPNELAGIPGIDKYRDQIIEAAHHLLAFIGTGDEPGFDPDEEMQGADLPTPSPQ